MASLARTVNREHAAVRGLVSNIFRQIDPDPREHPARSLLPLLEDLERHLAAYYEAEEQTPLFLRVPSDRPELARGIERAARAHRGIRSALHRVIAILGTTDHEAHRVEIVERLPMRIRSILSAIERLDHDEITLTQRAFLDDVGGNG
jgi:hypothetical protein